MSRSGHDEPPPLDPLENNIGPQSGRFHGVHKVLRSWLEAHWTRACLSITASRSKMALWSEGRPSIPRQLVSDHGYSARKGSPV
jgi:hypothetical protein